MGSSSDFFFRYTRGSSSKWMMSSSKYLSTSFTELLGFFFFEPAAIKPNNLGFLERILFSSTRA